jgi:hypothetical protein
MQHDIAYFKPNRSPGIYLFVFRADCRKPGSCDGGEVGLRIEFRNSLVSCPAPTLPISFTGALKSGDDDACEQKPVSSSQKQQPVRLSLYVFS